MKKEQFLARKTTIIQLLFFFITGIAVFLVSAQYDIFEKVHFFIKDHEDYNFDEFLIVSFFWVLFLLILTVFKTKSLHDQNIEIKKLSTVLEQQILARDRLQSILAHDLKTPFSSLIGLSDLMLKRHDELLADKRTEIMSIIHQTSKSTYSLLENLLEWTRLQSGKLVPSCKMIELLNVAVNVIDVLQSTAANKNITIKSVVPVGIFVYADENMVNTIIRNLLSNAVKYSYTGSSISITATIKQSYVEITVSDSGVGLTSDQINRLFNETIKSTPGTKHENGTGLGLKICKEFVEMNGGKIRVTSEKSKGTDFIFTLPLV